MQPQRPAIRGGEAEPVPTQVGGDPSVGNAGEVTVDYGSGRKYKRCHGSADRRQWRDVQSVTPGRGDEGDVVCTAGF